LGTLTAPLAAFKIMFALMRLRAVASRMPLRKRGDFGVALKNSSESMFSIALSIF
jgi:hypothetical protein